LYQFILKSKDKVGEDSTSLLYQQLDADGVRKLLFKTASSADSSLSSSEVILLQPRSPLRESQALDWLMQRLGMRLST
jgi:hypothetical protein